MKIKSLEKYFKNAMIIILGIYLGSNISSIESNVSISISKTWTVIDMLSIKWKSDMTDKIKQEFFQAVIMSEQLYGCTTWTNETLEEKSRRELHKDAECSFEQILEVA